MVEEGSRLLDKEGELSQAVSKLLFLHKVIHAVVDLGHPLQLLVDGTVASLGKTLETTLNSGTWWTRENLELLAFDNIFLLGELA